MKHEKNHKVALFSQNFSIHTRNTSACITDTKNFKKTSGYCSGKEFYIVGWESHLYIGSTALLLRHPMFFMTSTRSHHSSHSLICLRSGIFSSRSLTKIYSDLSLTRTCFVSFHIVTPDWKPKNIGRKTRLWSLTFLSTVFSNFFIFKWLSLSLSASFSKTSVFFRQSETQNFAPIQTKGQTSRNIYVSLVQTEILPVLWQPNDHYRVSGSNTAFCF